MVSGEDMNRADEQDAIDAIDDIEEYDDAFDDADEPQGNQGSPVDELAEFVQYMINNLVDDPNVVEVRPEQFGSNVHIKVIVPESDMGKVIGRQGRIARSMRTLLTIAASRKGLRASLDIDS
jgi:uncharacterized protein